MDARLWTILALSVCCTHCTDNIRMKEESWRDHILYTCYVEKNACSNYTWTVMWNDKIINPGSIFYIKTNSCSISLGILATDSSFDYSGTYTCMFTANNGASHSKLFFTIPEQLQSTHPATIHGSPDTQTNSMADLIILGIIGGLSAILLIILSIVLLVTNAVKCKGCVKTKVCFAVSRSSASQEGQLEAPIQQPAAQPLTPQETTSAARPLAPQETTSAAQPLAPREATLAAQPPAAPQETTSAAQPPAAPQETTSATQPPAAPQETTLATRPPATSQETISAARPPATQQETTQSGMQVEMLLEMHEELREMHEELLRQKNKNED